MKHTRQTYARAWQMLCAWAHSPEGFPCQTPWQNVEYACNLAEMLEEEAEHRLAAQRAPTIGGRLRALFRGELAGASAHVAAARAPKPKSLQIGPEFQ